MPIAGDPPQLGLSRCSVRVQQNKRHGKQGHRHWDMAAREFMACQPQSAAAAAAILHAAPAHVAAIVRSLERIRARLANRC